MSSDPPAGDPHSARRASAADDLLVHTLARARHAAWVQSRITAGWRPGLGHDESARIDPRLVSFDRLDKTLQTEWLGETAELLAVIDGAGLRLVPGDLQVAAEALDQGALQALRFRELMELYHQHRDNWRSSPENFLLLGESLMQRSEPVSAYEIFQAGVDAVEHAPICDVPLRRRLLQKAAQSLADTGALRESERILGALYAAGNRDGETLGLLAKVHKRVAIDSGDERALAMALKLYRQGYEEAEAHERPDDAIYNGINAATMARLSGNSDLSSQILARVRALCLAKGRPGYWDLASLGECCLLEGNVEAAAEHYAEAAANAPLRDRLSMWQQALLISDRLNLDSTILRPVFAPPSVLVFCGHRLDRQEAAKARFPASQIESIRSQIRTQIDRIQPGFGYCSAMCGSDILFIEEMLSHGAEVHVYLPFAATRFAEEYIAYAGTDWLERFDAVLSRVDSVTTVGQWDIGLNDKIHEFCSLYAFGAALLQHHSSRCDLHGLMVWDGVRDSRHSGTAAVANLWHEFGLGWDRIHPAGSGQTQPPDACGETEQDTRHTFLPMMFADVRGYSRLSGLQLYIFAERFMQACSRVLQKHDKGIYSTRSQGDSLFVVFRDLQSAVDTTRALRDMIAATDWVASGLPADLSARFALDCGPCYTYTDPVTGRREICGAHVIRAARLEPVTPPGHIYASESFAALSAVKKIEADFEAAGSIMLPKSYGQMRVYHLC